jgi:hypothetical protein
MAMDPGKKTALAVAAGTIAAGVYFAESRRQISEDGKSYLSPWTTDVAAWGAGATLIWLGYKHRSFVITFMGAAIAALHIAELVTRKTPIAPTLDDVLARRLPIQDRDQHQQEQTLRELEAMGAL